MDYLNHLDTERLLAAALLQDAEHEEADALAWIPADATASLRCVIHGNGILAGAAVAQRIFHQVDPTLTFESRIADGSAVRAGDIAFEVSGHTRSLLRANVLARQFMQRMSGIATFTHGLAERLQGLPTQLSNAGMDTPLMRHFDEWAVVIGGGVDHRDHYQHSIFIDEPHIEANGGVEPTMKKAQTTLAAKQGNGRVVVKTPLDKLKEKVLEQLREGDEDLFRRIILILHHVQQDGWLLRDLYPEIYQAIQRWLKMGYKVELAGNFPADDLREIAGSGVHYISMGAMLPQARNLDIALELIPS